MSRNLRALRVVKAIETGGLLSKILHFAKMGMISGKAQPCRRVLRTGSHVNPSHRHWYRALSKANLLRDDTQLTYTGSLKFSRTSMLLQQK